MITKNIQVGHGIVVCVPEFNHPIKIAEKTATLDILSGGRLHGHTAAAHPCQTPPRRRPDLRSNDRR